MPALLRFGRYTVYIHFGDTDRHHLPHCHVRWTDGKASVELRDLRVLAGTLPRQARSVLMEHRDELIEAWNRLNPQQPME